MFEIRTPLFYVTADGRIEEHPLAPYCLQEGPVHPGGHNRLGGFRESVCALQQDRLMLLYDPTFKSIQERVGRLNLSTIDTLVKAAALLFTSGTTGVPIGAFKSHENLLSEAAVLGQLLPQKPGGIISTVSPIHLYGLLCGLTLPMVLGVPPVIKENFLPTEIVVLAEQFAPAVVVTTPLFIKALNRLPRAAPLEGALFISSTGHLDPQEAGRFENRYGARILSIYGSTETGGIGYRFGGTGPWCPLQRVVLSVQKERLVVQSPFVSSHLLKQDIQTTQSTITMTDMAQIDKDGTFELIGRDKELIKIAGKRLSLVEMEQAIEQVGGVMEALVLAGAQSDGIKEERLAVYVASRRPHKELQELIKGTLRTLYPNINIRFDLTPVEAIPKNPMGKKIRLNPHTLKEKQ